MWLQDIVLSMNSSTHTVHQHGKYNKNAKMEPLLRSFHTICLQPVFKKGYYNGNKLRHDESVMDLRYVQGN